MNKYVTGAVIKKLRESKNMTQDALAQKLFVSSKAVSKWETGTGFPDISLIEPLAGALDISVIELLNGEDIKNRNRSSNLSKSRFYVCPVCGNIIHATGEAVVSCCGITLPPLVCEDEDSAHIISVSNVEDEYYVTLSHPMTKEHYISFITAVSDDGVQVRKLYPEGCAEARFKRRSVKYIYAYCNHHGLFRIQMLNKMKGEMKMDYKNEVKEKWGETQAYAEFEEKTKNYSKVKLNEVTEGLDGILAEFAACMKQGNKADSAEAKTLVSRLQGYISDSFYTCTNEILFSLGQMYVSDERLKTNIDKHGEGTAEFIRKAIDFFVKSK